MRASDELSLEYPFLDVRQLSKILVREGHPRAGRLHFSSLMAQFGITALYRKPYTSKRHPGHKACPYPLRHLAIERAVHVWAMGITHLPTQRDFIFLAAVMDRATRRGLAWRQAWTAPAAGVTTCSWNVFGARSSTKGLPARLPQRQQGHGWRRPILRVLQPSAPTHRARRPDPRRGILHPTNLIERGLKDIWVTRRRPADGFMPPQRFHLRNVEFCLDKPGQISPAPGPRRQFSQL
jgi:hypothetical protein